MTDEDMIRFVYRGENYSIPHDMRALRQVERVVMRPEVQEDLQHSQVLCPVDIAEIFRNLLRLADVEATTEQVRYELFGPNADAKETLGATQVVMAILEQRAPPESLSEEAKKKQPAKTKQRRSGKKPTKSP